ncbi:sensor histidine kinase [Aquimarina litoralis]|uniref:sensor histidine kinase n=1 Tax=Aquimarina litoralis TaxID=584605 RepID=UPI001C5640C7|nr:sensor histidine kinase [Aquimarina litoralis]MBW1295085.1 sensor histidine kinase [Aquimarina litoralis]
MVKKLSPNRVLRHVLYWISLIIFFGITWGTYDNDYVRSFTIQTFSLPARMILVYVSLYILLPKLFSFKRFFLFIFFYLITLLLVSVCVQRPIIYFYVQPNYLPGWQSEGYFTITELVNTILDVNIAAVVPIGMSFFRLYYNSQQKTLALEKEKIEAELIQLRNQVHPHFLFNTLNNLYALIIKKSDDAEVAVLKLSKLMRYMLYEANTDKVSIKKEISYLKNYVDLEKLRFGNFVDISFHSELDDDYLIAPFLIIPFVENAFKHGTSSSKKSWIVINISTKQNKLVLHIENSKFQNNHPEKNFTGGIGFTNVKKRLDLLYPNNYSLDINDSNESFEVLLQLNFI